jgi:hypothetical protein
MVENVYTSSSLTTAPRHSSLDRQVGMPQEFLEPIRRRTRNYTFFILDLRLNL